MCRLGASKPVRPHVADQNDLERVGRVAEALGQGFPARFVADMPLPLGRVGCRARHDDLDASAGVIVVVPVRAQSHEFVVEVDADAAAHAHDHRLALHGLAALVEVGDDVVGDEMQPLCGAHDGFELRPPGLKPLFAFDLLALGRLLEIRVDVRTRGFVQRQLREAALVVNRHRGAVLHGTLDVVDADVVPEHGPGVGVLELDGRAREADERGVGQRVAHVAGVAVDEVVLAPVRLVGDHHDVAAVGQQRVPVPFLLGEELLDRGEDHAARCDGELRPQVRAARGLRRRLAQEVAAPGEGAEELVVEIIAIGEHDDGGIAHGGLADDAAGVERHGQALARALGVPDDADAAVAGLAAGEAARLVASPDVAGLALELRCAQRLGDGGLDGVELVVARHLFRERPAVVLEHDEVAQQGEETSPVADARQHHLQLGCARVGQGLAGDRPPGLEPLAARRERSNPGIHAVGDDQDGIHGEQGRQFIPVGLQLPPCGPDRGVLVARILHFDQAQRKAVDEQHGVGPSLVVVLDDRELVGGEPVVAGGPLEVDDLRLGAPDRAFVAVLHRHAVDQHAVEGAVAGFERCARGTDQLAEGVVECGLREVGVEAGERASEPRGEHDFAVICPFGYRAVGRDVGAVDDSPVEAEQPVECGVFDLRFGNTKCQLSAQHSSIDRYSFIGGWRL